MTVVWEEKFPPRMKGKNHNLEHGAKGMSSDNRAIDRSQTKNT